MTTTLIRPEPLSELSVVLLESGGMSREDAVLATDVLVMADIRGVGTHGVSNMLRVYLDWLGNGHTNPTPTVRVVNESIGTATLDGDRGLGVVVAPMAMRMAIEKASHAGIGAVTIGNSRHLGMAAYHAELALKEGMIGICTTAVGPFVVPTFGREPRLGTNPIAVAVPAKDEPAFVFDAATSAIPGNRITSSYREGKPLPAGVVADTDGTPVMTERMGPSGYAGARLLPLGSTREAGSHKGYGLGMIVEILSSVLSGSRFMLEQGHDHATHFVMALDVAAFTDPETFRSTMDDLLRAMKSTPPAAGHDRVLVAGQLEWETEIIRRREGIPLNTEVVEWFDQAAATIGVRGLSERTTKRQTS